MYGAGQNIRATLLNCYVIPIKNDSLESIFDWCKESARTYSFGGGVGTDIGILRPKGAPVNNSARYSTGAVSFMELFSTTIHLYFIFVFYLKPFKQL
jgi:ribonucleoside-diphosphate reductase alpha chain